MMEETGDGGNYFIWKSVDFLLPYAYMISTYIQIVFSLRMSGSGSIKLQLTQRERKETTTTKKRCNKKYYYKIDLFCAWFFYLVVQFVVLYCHSLIWFLLLLCAKCPTLVIILVVFSFFANVIVIKSYWTIRSFFCSGVKCGEGC